MARKPERVADNPLGTPYGTNLSAPAMTVPDVKGYRKEQAAEASHRFHQRYNELEQQMQDLMTQADYNDRLLSADLAFKPIIGKTYFLYNQDGKDSISMISPLEWGESYMMHKSFIGAYKILADNVWIQVDNI